MKFEELLVNGQITALCRRNMSPKQYIKRYEQQKWTLKTKPLGWEVSKSSIAIPFDLPQICASKSVLPLVFAVHKNLWSDHSNETSTAILSWYYLIRFSSFTLESV